MSKANNKKTNFIYPDEARRDIAKQIRLAREAKRLTLRDVEAETHSLVKRAALHNYEQRKFSPPADILPCLSSVYDVTIEKFFPPLPRQTNVSIDRFESLLSQRSFRELLQILEEMSPSQQRDVIHILLELLKFKEK